MSRRGGCGQCAWLRCGKTCTSEEAMKLTSKGNLQPFFNTKVKELKKYWDNLIKRHVTEFQYHGCFLHTFKTDKMQGVSGFLRRRTHAD